jgi:zinc protease
MFRRTLLAFVPLALAVQPAVSQLPTLDTPLPVDSAVTVGVLENGLHYYIRANTRPENRAELRLVVNAGSVLEDDDQLGLAHFVEHMAFNGTEHYPRQELVEYLERIGMRFGPDINATTSFDETVYMLTVPTDTIAVFNEAFQILDDWAHLVSFDDEEIDRERGVVIEEWRLGRGADARMLDSQFPVLFRDSRYAVRLPIGDPELLEAFPYDAARRFYRDWYRPDLMAVIAVGDFDPAHVENLIRQHFAHIAPATDPRPRTVFEVPGHSETLVTVATDAEATNSTVSVYFKQALREAGTVGAYRQGIVERLYTGMLNNRFFEITQTNEIRQTQVSTRPNMFGRFSRGRPFPALRWSMSCIRPSCPTSSSTRSTGWRGSGWSRRIAWCSSTRPRRTTYPSPARRPCSPSSRM